MKGDVVMKKKSIRFEPSCAACAMARPKIIKGNAVLTQEGIAFIVFSSEAMIQGTVM